MASLFLCTETWKLDNQQGGHKKPRCYVATVTAFFLTLTPPPSFKLASYLRRLSAVTTPLSYHVLVYFTGNKGQKWTCSAQARARWFLALTLARNPELASERKPDILAPEPIHGSKADDVNIEVGQYGSDNAGLI